jgi:hypothetical protein
MRLNVGHHFSDTNILHSVATAFARKYTILLLLLPCVEYLLLVPIDLQPEPLRLFVDPNPLHRRVKCRPLLEWLTLVHRSVPPIVSTRVEPVCVGGQGCIREFSQPS